jgi:hypothetical protein
VPLSEIELRASRPSGPGGQHANVTASRIEASFDVAASGALTEEQKRRMIERAGARVTAIYPVIPIPDRHALAIGNAVLGMALGLFVSAFAATEFQAVQFMPAFVLPQILLCGLLIEREEMARALELVSSLLPLTYAYDALARATADDLGQELLVDVAVVGGAVALALLLGATTLRRRTA